MTDIDLSDLAADRNGSQPLRGYLANGTEAISMTTRNPEPENPWTFPPAMAHPNA